VPPSSLPPLPLPPPLPPLAQHWTLSPEVVLLNHGSFGACPRSVLDAQARWRARMEAEPVRFFTLELEPALDASRAALAPYLNARPDDLVFVRNATAGVNAVLRSLALAPGDELLVTSQGYGACTNAASFVGARTGARLVTVDVPFPTRSPGDVVEAVLSGVGPRTRLAIVDHVTSPTGAVWPIAEVVRELTVRGVEALVDGAHAPGMVEVDIGAIGAAYYTGNCHKWLCAPKGAAFLHVRADKQAGLHPAIVSHGLTIPRNDRPRLHLEFDWCGTDDPSAVLCIPDALRFLETVVPGGLAEVRARNRSLALVARDTLSAALGPPPLPPSMIGALVAFPIRPGAPMPPYAGPYIDPTQERLYAEARVEVPIFPWPAPPRRVLRVSAHLYNTPAQYARLAEWLEASGVV
jgi:isopenicillin-N epimerase